MYDNHKDYIEWYKFDEYQIIYRKVNRKVNLMTENIYYYPKPKFSSTVLSKFILMSKEIIIIFIDFY